MVMGVSGAGKSIVGRTLAERLGWAFLDCDDLHPVENVRKMQRGEALDDADREPWLIAICERLAQAEARHESQVLACSALKRIYRSRFAAAAQDLLFVYLQAAKAQIEQRLRERRGHFMSPALIDSQFAALEEPEPSDSLLLIDAALPLADKVAGIVKRVAP